MQTRNQKLQEQIALPELTEPTVRTLLDLGPFGAGNASPRFATDWLELEGEPRAVGAGGDHLQFALREDRFMKKAIGFGLAKHLQALRDSRRCRVAFEPIINSFNGRRSVELQVADIQFPE